MTPEAKLKALFASARPAARDYAFEAVVAEKVARRRAWARVGAMTPWAVAGVAGLWAVQPAMGPFLDSLAGLQTAGVTLAGAAVAVLAALQMARSVRRV